MASGEVNRDRFAARKGQRLVISTQARQLIRHGFLLINGRRCDIPSYLVRPGDAIRVKPRPKILELVQANVAENKKEVPDFLAVAGGADPEGHVLRRPGIEDVSIPVQVQLILELCSK